MVRLAIIIAWSLLRPFDQGKQRIETVREAAGVRDGRETCGELVRVMIGTDSTIQESDDLFANGGCGSCDFCIHRQEKLSG